MFNKIYIGVVTLIVVLSVGVTGYIIVKANDNLIYDIYERVYEVTGLSQKSDINLKVNSSLDNNLEGKIFLSIVSSDGVPYPALIDVSNKDVFTLPVSEINGSQAVSLQYSMSSDESYLTYLATTKDTLTDPEAYDVYLAKTGDVEDASEFMSRIMSAQVVAGHNDDDYLKMAPVVSVSGQVLYSSLGKENIVEAEGEISKIAAESWSIYLVVNNKKTLVANGLYPKWIDETRFAYLQNDGVYLYNTETKSKQLVWRSLKSANIVNGFEVSDNGEYFVFSSPQEELVTIVRVLDWQENIFTVLPALSIVATSPIFSSNNEYIAFITSQRDAEETDKIHTGIRYYSLKERQYLTNVVWVDKDTVDGVYITDWR